MHNAGSSNHVRVDSQGSFGCDAVADVGVPLASAKASGVQSLWQAVECLYEGCDGVGFLYYCSTNQPQGGREGGGTWVPASHIHKISTKFTKTLVLLVLQIEVIFGRCLVANF